MCFSGCTGYRHAVTLCPHSAGCNSPVWLSGSSLAGYLGSGRASQNAQVNFCCFTEKTYPWSLQVKVLRGSSELEKHETVFFI